MLLWNVSTATLALLAVLCFGCASSARPQEQAPRAQRSDAENLEEAIENELKRSECDLTTGPREPGPSPQVEAVADPLAAPGLPRERDIPDSVFDVEQRTIGGVPKLWKSLDADRDGAPEILIQLDARSGALESRSEDTNYDGKLDADTTYGGNGLVSRSEDTDYDGRPDSFIRYSQGRATRIEIDRDGDGRRDRFLTYTEGSLAREEYDDEEDGSVSRRIDYADRKRTRVTDDRDNDGTMETWIYLDARELPSRIERDTNRDGKPDVWETYEGADERAMEMVRKDEDLDADGQPDRASFYDHGKLSRTEPAHPGIR